MGIVCKAVAIILFLFMLLSGVASGDAWLEILVVGVLMLFLYGIGEIIDQLQLSNLKKHEIKEMLRKLMPEENNTEPYIPPAPKVRKTADGGWICKRCSTENDKDARFCKECGEYK